MNTKLHLVAADAHAAIACSLSPGQAHDAPEGRKLRNRLGQRHASPAPLRDRASAGAETRPRASARGYEPGAPPWRTWEYDRELDQRHHASERLLRRWQGFRGSSSRYEKLAGAFLGSIVAAMRYDRGGVP